MTRSGYLGLLAVGAALLSVGCQTSTCDRSEDATVIHQGMGKTGSNTWFSSPFYNPSVALSPSDEGYAYFPPARTITFEHDLGSVPVVAITLAFNENGSLAPTAGNQAIIECMDNQVVQIKNDTCSDFYIWIQAQGSGISQTTPCCPKNDPNPSQACQVAMLNEDGTGGAAADPGTGGMATDAVAGAGGANP